MSKKKSKSRFLYSVGDKKLGPVSGAELKKLAADGTLRPDATVWKEGIPTGVPASKAKGLNFTAQASSDSTTSALSNSEPAKEAEDKKYWAFISYSSKDKKWGKWLHKRLENHPIPKELQGFEFEDGTKLGKFVRPVFRDRDELAGSEELGPAIRQALSDSRYLIVLCSPHAARSRWVDKEIADFRSVSPAGNVLALIIDGEPNATTNTAFQDEEECFPPQLRSPFEPLAGDLRTHGDGKERGFLKILAGVAQVGFDELYSRHLRAQRQKLLYSVAVATGVIAMLLGLTVYATRQTRFANSQSKLAEDRQQAAVEATRVAESRLAEQFVKDGLEKVENGLPATAALLFHKALEIEPDPIRQGYHRLRLGFATDSVPDLVRYDGAPPFRRNWISKDLNQDQKLQTSLSLKKGPNTTKIELPIAHGTVSQVILSNDEKFIVTTTYSELQIWKRSDLSRPETTIEFTSQLWCVTCALNDRLLAVGCEDGHVHLIERKEDAFRKTSRTLRHDARIRRMNFDQESELLATADREGVGRIWRLGDDSQIGEDLRHRGAINDIRFNDSGTMVVTTSWDRTARVWDAMTGKPITPFLEHSSGVSYGGFCSGDRLLWTYDGDDRFWALGKTYNKSELNLREGKTLFVPRGEGATFARTSNRGSVVAINDLDKVQIRDVLTGQRAGAEIRPRGRIHNLQFSADDYNLLTWTSDGLLQVWDCQTSTQLGKDVLHEGLRAAKFSPDGKTVATVGDDKSLRLWGSIDGLPKTSFKFESALMNLLFSPDGATLVTIGKDFCHTVDIASGQSRKTDLRDGKRSFWAYHGAFSDDGACLSIGPYLYRWPSLEKLDDITFESGSFRDSPSFGEFSRVVAKTNKQSIVVKNWRTKETVFTAEFDTDITAFKLCPTGNLLAVGESNGRLSVFELDSGYAVATSDHHARGIRSLGILSIDWASNTTLVTASTDGLVRRWNFSLDQTTAAMGLIAIHASKRISDSGRLIPLNSLEEEWKKLASNVSLPEFPEVPSAFDAQINEMIYTRAMACRAAIETQLNNKVGTALIRGEDIFVATQRAVGSARWTEVEFSAACLTRASKLSDDREIQLLAQLQHAVVLALKGKHESVIQLLQPLIEDVEKYGSPSTVAGYYSTLGAALIRSGNMSKGKRLLTNAVKLYESEPDSAEKQAIYVNTAKALFAMKDYENAAETIEAAIQIATNMQSTELEISSMRDLQIYSLMESGQFDKAEPLCLGQIQLYSSVGVFKRPLTGLLATSQLRLSVIYTSRREFSKAIPLLEQAIVTLRLTSRSGEHADAAQLLGLCWLGLSQHKKAVPYFEEELVLRRKQHPDNFAAIAATVGRTAISRLRSGDAKGAQPLMRQLLENSLAASPQDALAIANWRSGLGRCLLGQQEYEEAEEYLRLALATRRDSLGESHAATILTLAGVAELYAKTKRLDEAGALIREPREKALSKIEQLNADGKFLEAASLFTDGLPLLEASGHVADAYLKVGQKQEAIQWYEHQASLDLRIVLVEAATDSVPRHLDLAAAGISLAVALLECGLEDKALEQYRSALSVYERSDRSEDAQMISSLVESRNDFGAVLLKLGRIDEAIVEFEAAIDVSAKVARSAPNKDHAQADLIKAYSKLGNTCLKYERKEKGVEHLRLALTLQKALSRGAPKSTTKEIRLSKSYEQLGTALARIQRPEDAIPEFEAAFAIRKSLTAEKKLSSAGKLATARLQVKLGDSLHRAGREAAAIAMFSSATEANDRILAENQDDPELRHQVARAATAMGGIHSAHGNHDEALKQYRRALTLRTSLADAKTSDNQPRLDRDLMLAHFNVGLAEYNQFRLDRASASFRASLVTLEGMNEQTRNSEQWKRDLEIVQGVLADCSLVRASREDLSDVPPERLATVLVARGKSFANEGDVEEVLFCGSQLRGLGGATNLYNAACSYSLAITALKAQKAAENDVKEIRRLAITCLEESLDAGFEEPALMNRDEDLDSIRESPEFQTLLNRTR